MRKTGLLLKSTIPPIQSLTYAQKLFGFCVWSLISLLIQNCSTPMCLSDCEYKSGEEWQQCSDCETCKAKEVTEEDSNCPCGYKCKPENRGTGGKVLTDECEEYDGCLCSEILDETCFKNYVSPPPPPVDTGNGGGGTDIKEDKPILYNFAFNYPSDSSNLAVRPAIEDWRRRTAELNWDSVSFLFEHRDSDGKFLYNFSQAGDWAQNAQSSYEKAEENYEIRVESRITAESMVEKMKEAAVVNIIAHGGIRECKTIVEQEDGTQDISVDSLGVLFLSDYESQLSADTKAKQIECGFCEDNLHPMGKGCGAGSNDSQFLDSVLLAVVVSCRSGAGTTSIKDALLEYGVDCVVSTDRRMPTLFAHFWNRNFWIKAATLPVKKAAEEAYDASIEQMVSLFGYADEKMLFDHYRGVNGENLLPTNWEELLQVNGNCDTLLVYPARNGELIE